MYLSGDPVAQVEVDMTNGVAANRYIHTDALGSPVVVTNGPHVEQERGEYEPYGLVINRPLRDGPGYTGHAEDAGSGLNYMQQRYYDPQIGRFIGVDPATISSNTGANFSRYWYANNNPYRFTDPDGRFARGEGWTPQDWRDFDAAQQDAARDYAAAAKRLTDAIAAGGDQFAAAQAKFQAAFGKGSGTTGNMQKMAANLSKMAAALKTHDKSTGFVANAKLAGEMSAAYVNFGPAVAMGVPPGASFVVVNKNHGSFGGFKMMGDNVAHEAAHAVLKLRDQVDDKGAKAIYSGDASQKASFMKIASDPAKALVNPDTIMRYAR